MQNLRLRYSNPAAADEERHDVDVKLCVPFEFEGREWIADTVERDGFTLCTEHERTFNVQLDDGVYSYTGPFPAKGEVIALKGGERVRIDSIALAHHDVRRGSLRAERIDS